MATTPPSDNPGVFDWRLKRLESLQNELHEWKEKVDEERVSVRGRVATVERDIDRAVRGLDALRKVLIAFAVTVASSSVIFAVSILAATGRL